MSQMKPTNPTKVIVSLKKTTNKAAKLDDYHKTIVIPLAIKLPFTSALGLPDCKIKGEAMICLSLS